MPAITSATVERLGEELHTLETVDLPAVRADIEHARSAGDIAENNDLFVALDAEAQLLRRVAKIKSALEGAARSGVCDEVSTDTVTPGVVVEVDFGDGESDRYLVGSIEERPAGLEVLTPDSALGSALLGARPGETVSYETPSGSRLDVRLVAIEAFA